ncbi:hypothetical protein AB1Y20_013306 [Prymnesium parvum]|uniref:CRAL-TRIO domain-containing protein n=1 Tax=Prymnesium parvum TaxID=97485 RepID=A0AB34IL49_PRYPA
MLLALLLVLYVVAMLTLVSFLQTEALDPSAPHTAVADDHGFASRHANAQRQLSVFAPPMASADEERIIAAAVDLLSTSNPPLRGFLERRPPLAMLHMQLLRHLRALGAKGTASALAGSYRRAWERRAANHEAAVERRGEVATWQMPASAGHWPAARELTHGEWAVRFVKIGLNCGRTTCGCPVKVERIGTYDTSAIVVEAHGEEKLKEFYHSLLECQAEALDTDSLAAGRMLRAYEVFDLRGIRLAQVNLATLRFARSMLTTFSMCYPETTSRAVIINMPSFLRMPLRGLLEVLPERVRAKVSIFGDDYQQVLASELDADALKLLSADHNDVVSHRCPR